MKTKIIACFLLSFLLSACAWETGHAVVISPNPINISTTELSDEVLIDVFTEIAKKLEMEVKGPEKVNDTYKSYEATFSNQKKGESYFLILSMDTHRKTIIIRTLNSNSPKNWSDEALKVIKKEFDNRGFSCELHNT